MSAPLSFRAYAENLDPELCEAYDAYVERVKVPQTYTVTLTHSERAELMTAHLRAHHEDTSAYRKLERAKPDGA